MEICFIWVEQFRNLTDFNLNLSNSVKFQYNSLDNTISKVDITPLPQSFFGPSIDEVTGLIGRNGSGKSNAIELICKVLKGAKTSLNTDFILIVRDGGAFICYHSLRNRLDPAKASFSMIFREYEKSINPLKVVYFTNVYNHRKSEFDKEVADISINRKPRSTKKKEISDFEKQIKFIDSDEFKDLEISLPVEVLFASKVWTPRPYAGRDYYNVDFSIRDSFDEIRRFLRDRVRKINDTGKFVYTLRYAYFTDFMAKFVGLGNFGEGFAESLKKFVSDITVRETESATEALLNFIQDITWKMPNDLIRKLTDSIGELTSSEAFDLIQKQIDFLRDMPGFVQEILKEHNTEGARAKSVDYFRVHYERNGKEFIKHFVALFGELKDVDVNWVGISSGEKAYLNLFSSIRNEIRFTRQPNLLICIDEGDLYLHPRWQTEFFDRLLLVLPKIYSGKIQLVLTSHSPFLLSDLPNQCVTILDTSQTSQSLDGVHLKMKTFGGNLYDLYAEPFFLGRKRMSDFAYRKISSLVLALESDSVNKRERATVGQLVDLIGDEVIRYKLEKML
ncbi:ATP-binding protein [Flaviaesturariibacter flavus]|uniref:ATP-binding protein n=1 Tax=Flaviaesturariibacter flavus TaxID=2502780 RepID=A0A4R1BIG5_9BACT|nr:AAA family ATPase [Flaviaesturariibacter flavus]TCJ17076.1 ATP-binding protein [Flaviaesturariibacter flavus]